MNRVFNLLVLHIFSPFTLYSLIGSSFQLVAFLTELIVAISVLSCLFCQLLRSIIMKPLDPNIG